LNSKKKKHKSGVWLTEAQAALSWGVILALLAVLGAVYLYQASRTAGAGRRVQSLQSEIDDVKRVNAALERDIAEAQSLERLQAEAITQGFVRPPSEEIEYIVVLLNKVTEVPFEAEVPSAEPSRMVGLGPIETINEALWLLFRSSIGDFIQGESR
jgi:cell division protein FtsL